MKKLLCITAALLSGCAPSASMVSIKLAEIDALNAVQIKIIEGHYKSQEEENVPEKVGLIPDPPEGSGIDAPCSEKCLDNCDEQCRTECPQTYLVLCGPYMQPTADDFDFSASKTISGSKPTFGETVSNSSGGGYNNQANITGNNNSVIVQSGQNGSGKTDPVEKAMADLLRARVSPLKSGSEEIRGFIKDTARAVVEVAPAALTGYAIHTAGKAVSSGFEAAGDKNDGSFNDLSDRSIKTTTEVVE